VEIAKLREYCLSADHPRGRHKARVFAAVLGLTAEHCDSLRDALLEAARNEETAASDKDEYGQRYVVDFTMDGSAGKGRIRSS
jgi:hypothetical protein